MAHFTPADNIKHQATGALRQASTLVERLARLGYAAKGVVYLIIGILALEAAFSLGGKVTDSRGALATLFHAPFGQFLLALVAVGLAGFALWRLIQALADPEHRGSNAKGIARRLGEFISGVAYALLAYASFQMLAGIKSQASSTQSTQDWTARFMSEPFGRWLVGAVGLVVIGIGIGNIVKSYKADTGKDLKLDEMSAEQRQWAIRSGRLGIAALGVVFGIVGLFLLEAAIQADPTRARGLDGALRTLAHQPFGPWVLGIVAAGLIAYGLFMLFEARYRRIPL